MLPLPFPASTITLAYGDVDGEFYTFSSPHQGTDFSSRSQGVTAGTVFRASGPGRVVRSGVGPAGVYPSIDRPNSLAGNSIDVDYGDFIARYMHRPFDSPSPKVGAATVEGTLLGVVGSTGLGDGGAHLHMETWDKRTGRRVDPSNYFDFTRTITTGGAAGDGATPFNPTPEPLQGGKMTIYVRRDDGLIVAIPEGGKTYNYQTVAEYNDHRATVAVLNGQRAATGQPLVTLPPALDGDVKTRIVTMTPAKINALIRAQGAFS